MIRFDSIRASLLTPSLTCISLSPPLNHAVCIKVIQDVRDSMDKADWKDKPKVEAALGKYCSSDLPSRQRKVCYYLDPIKRDIAQPFSTGMPADRVCKRINNSNAEICGVKFPVKAEKLSPEEVKKLRVKQLKSILADRGVTCDGCLEKEEFVQKVLDTDHLSGRDEF